MTARASRARRNAEPTVGVPESDSSVPQRERAGSGWWRTNPGSIADHAPVCGQREPPSIAFCVVLALCGEGLLLVHLTETHHPPAEPQTGNARGIAPYTRDDAGRCREPSGAPSSGNDLGSHIERACHAGKAASRWCRSTHGNLWQMTHSASSAGSSSSRPTAKRPYRRPGTPIPGRRSFRWRGEPRGGFYVSPGVHPGFGQPSCPRRLSWRR
jgi:hypothetical protein